MVKNVLRACMTVLLFGLALSACDSQETLQESPVITDDLALCDCCW